MTGESRPVSFVLLASAGRSRYVTPPADQVSGKSRRYRAPVSAADDLASLPPAVASAANIDANGEVWWWADTAESAVVSLANAGFVVLGLDLRSYDEDGRFFEIAWSAFEPTGRDDVERGREAALAALARPDRLGNAVLITWQPSL